jgi:CDGSH iron-sulfur domain-containing protein 3
MSRLIRHDAKGPAIIQIAPGKFIEVCQCGLSQNKPFCDGSHSKTHDEQEHQLYVYDAEHNRIAIPDMFPPPRRKFEPPE